MESLADKLIAAVDAERARLEALAADPRCYQKSEAAAGGAWLGALVEKMRGLVAEDLALSRTCGSNGSNVITNPGSPWPGRMVGAQRGYQPQDRFTPAPPTPRNSGEVLLESTFEEGD